MKEKKKTNDIVVSAKSYFLSQESNPEKDIYTFAYTITIENNGSVGATLLSRHWIITDENNKSEEVIGEGVIGKQPYIAAGQSYQYSSGAIIKTSIGIMQGSYHLISDKGERFKASIPAFSLLAVNVLN